MMSSITDIFVDFPSATPANLQEMGGKAATLAHLQLKGFPVPEGSVLLKEPHSDETWASILSWWDAHGHAPLATRSSASGEDSGDFSYAGQFKTFLNLTSEQELREAIKNCFASVHQESSNSYAQHFNREEIPMHVLIQRMVRAQFAGVFFSKDPRQKDSTDWLVEVVSGLGEQLVSGQVTPYRFSPKTTAACTADGWKSEYLNTIVEWGKKIEAELGYSADVEWAIDHDGTFWVLQSRPITTISSNLNSDTFVAEEFQLLEDTFPADTSWDGHSFAEWKGVPSEFSYQVWAKAFSKNGAFDLALKEIGYEGISTETVLNRVFGKAYLNLSTMADVYFGKSPYKVVSQPQPHLEFSWDRLNITTLFNAPKGLYEMTKVAWKIQTQRKEIAQKALLLAKSNYADITDSLVLKSQTESTDLKVLKGHLQSLVQKFSAESLHATFLITLLIESTLQGLAALLEKDLGPKEAQNIYPKLTLSQKNTRAMDMHDSLESAYHEANSVKQFMKDFGHRGPGELDLAAPRWNELEIKTNQSSSKSLREHPQDAFISEVLEKVSSIRRPIFKQEVEALQYLLGLREEIKMEIMKPYAQIRWVLLQIADLLKIGNDIFEMTPEEVLHLDSRGLPEKSKQAIQIRKARAQAFRNIDLPLVFSLGDLQKIVAGNKLTENSSALQGVTLSSGITAGKVHIVNNPQDEILDTWDPEVILVAEATDPAWTPLFEKAKGIIVSKGGVLSHCAIVAREMGIVAIGEIIGATQIFKEGEYVWLDGNSGIVRRAH